jgi:diaminohydroxyphosphoribosylaminopyrimidine deaminase/5-amino-6-(5-phosphoribosylamino)uracil reductase
MKMTPMQQKRADENYMREALGLAMNGTGGASPNPRVGCVIVKDGRVLGRGWHHRCGQPHAEVEAVRDAGGNVAGATVYVTLEPCCHYGKTPPCAQMLIERKVVRVVAGMTDPNPIVDHKGFRLLEEAGIAVTVGTLEQECRWMNRGFIRRMTLGRPWITVKIASSLDGDIALKDGSSRWVTGPESRAKVHMLRAENDALLTGVGTILADDPELTVRETPGRSPLRVVLDHELRTPLEAKILNGGNVLFFTDKDVPAAKKAAFTARGAIFETLDCRSGEEINYIVKKLCEKGVNYLMVEAGAKVTSSFLRSGLTDEASLFLAPKLMGAGLHFTEELSVARMENAIAFKDIAVEKCGGDLWIKGVLACSPDL